MDWFVVAVVLNTIAAVGNLGFLSHHLPNRVLGISNVVVLGVLALTA